MKLLVAAWGSVSVFVFVSCGYADLLSYPYPSTGPFYHGGERTRERAIAMSAKLVDLGETHSSVAEDIHPCYGKYKNDHFDDLFFRVGD